MNSVNGWIGANQTPFAATSSGVAYNIPCQKGTNFPAFKKLTLFIGVDQYAVYPFWVCLDGTVQLPDGPQFSRVTRDLVA